MTMKTGSIPKVCICDDYGRDDECPIHGTELRETSVPYKQSMTDAEIDTVLGPATPERDREIQGWTGKAGTAFKEGWEMGYREALERAAKLLDDRVAALQKCGGDTYLQVCECSVMAREIRALSVFGDTRHEG